MDYRKEVEEATIDRLLFVLGCDVKCGHCAAEDQMIEAQHPADAEGVECQCCGLVATRYWLERMVLESPAALLCLEWPACNVCGSPTPSATTPVVCGACRELGLS